MDTNSPSAPPHTPQRGHNPYPAHLARAGDSRRVPLHRRGTSQKLECFEDLLREAGFKETRVFTPEAERVEAAAQARKRQAETLRGEKAGAPSLIELLSGLIPWRDSGGNGRSHEVGHTKTQSLGRAAGKQKEVLLNDGDDIFKSVGDARDVMITPTQSRRRPLTPIILSAEFTSPDSSSSSSSRSPPRSHLKPHFGVPQMDNPQYRKYCNYPDVRATLRHMMSAPDFALAKNSRQSQDFPRRVTESTAPRKPRRQPTGYRHAIRTSLQQETEAVPPLPQNWLSNIAHAVLGSSGGGEHVGRPQGSLWINRSKRALISQSSLRPSSVVRYSTEHTRRDGSLATRGFAPVTSRADTTPGIITPASVVCRSAPGSRSSSLVRKGSTGSRARGRPRTSRRDTCLPSLGVASVELAGSDLLGQEVNNEFARDGAVVDSPDCPSTSCDDDSSDEGELDFARLIVPARRQHSIHSLRRHLYNHAVASGVSGNANVPPSSYTTYGRVLRRPISQNSVRGRTRTSSNQADTSKKGSIIVDDPDDLDNLMRSRRVSNEEDAEDDMFADWAAHGLPGLENAVQKKRGAIPWLNRA